MNTQGATQSLHVYPNPASGEVFVSGLSANEQVLVNNLLGKTLWKGKADASGGAHFSVQHWSAGIYFIQTNNNTLKIIVKK